MNKSTQPTNKTNHHQATNAPNLPFSIDHILSSTPIKQAVDQHQQAAAMMMLNSAMPAAQDIVSTAMLNEQLALLAAGHQHQRLLNPTALAAAAAQQHLHQQWQHQQQLMAAAAAVSQHQQQSAALAPLNALSSLNSLAAASAQNIGAPPNLLSCFMASMLLQQQQHQHQQHQQHQKQQPPAHHHLNQRQPFAAADLAPGAIIANNDTVHRSPLVAGLAGASSPAKACPDRGSPFEPSKGRGAFGQCARKSPPVSAPGAHIGARGPDGSHQHQHQHQHQHRDASRPGEPSGRSQRAGRFEPDQRAKYETHSNRKSISPIPSVAKPASATSEHQSSAALSSLSNFVTKSLAPILDSDHASHQIGTNHKRSSSASSSTGPIAGKGGVAGAGAQKKCSGNPNGNVNSGSHEPISIGDQHQASGQQQQQQQQQHGASNKSPSSPSSILGAVANALRNSPGAVSINTTLAKAPPELVQKQPAWVFCTRYSDRPSSGPRTRRAKSKDKKAKDPKLGADEKRPRTAFTSEQLEKLRQEFQANSYLDEKRRKDLAERLCLNENQIKIWFQNKRAKIKKQSNQPNPLRGLLVAGGLYNHSTATSDCSESYANGLDHDVGNQAIGDVDEHDNTTTTTTTTTTTGNDDDDNNNEHHFNERHKKRPHQDDNHYNHADDSDSDNMCARSNETTSAKRQQSSANKRTRLSHSGSESGSDLSGSRIDDLDEDDERVISVS